MILYIFIQKGKKVLPSSQCHNIPTLGDWKFLEIISANIDHQRQSKQQIDQTFTKHIGRNNVSISQSINLHNCHHNIDIFGLNWLLQEFFYTSTSSHAMFFQLQNNHVIQLDNSQPFNMIITLKMEKNLQQIEL